MAGLHRNLTGLRHFGWTTRCGPRPAGGTSEEVAEVILAAVSNGTDRLRYVATEGIRAWVAAHRDTSEEAYIAVMRREVGLG